MMSGDFQRLFPQYSKMKSFLTKWGGLGSSVAKGQTGLSDFTFSFSLSNWLGHKNRKIFVIYILKKIVILEVKVKSVL